METKFCECGDTKSRFERFATQMMMVCAKCGITILDKEGNPIILTKDQEVIMEFSDFVYNHTADQIKEKYRSQSDLLKEGLKLKQLQDEEQYKREFRKDTK